MRIVVRANEPGGGHVVVAASGSHLELKALADFICDGVNDEVEIQHAIDHAAIIDIDDKGTYYISKSLKL